MWGYMVGFINGDQVEVFELQIVGDNFQLEADGQWKARYLVKCVNSSYKSYTNQNKHVRSLQQTTQNQTITALSIIKHT